MVNQDLLTTLSEKEIENFESVYDKLVQVLTTDSQLKDMPQTLTWLERVLHYNVPHGKKLRGLMVPITLKCIQNNPSDDDMQLAYIIGWCIEILQASFLVADDMMDLSETRRGQPCWYKVDDMGPIAFNDSLLLEHVVYTVLSKYIKDKSYYTKVVDLFLSVTYKTIFGQSLDTQTGNDRNMDEYTMERLTAIIKYKTSYYTIYLPIAAALAMLELKDPQMWEKVEEISLAIGHLFQSQDDYLDCFGDVAVIGKIGTDIQDCKCAWPFVTAKGKCTPEQYALLKENYGFHDDEKVERVKKLYAELDIAGDFKRYEEEAYTSIRKQVTEIGSKVPEQVFLNWLERLYKRDK